MTYLNFKIKYKMFRNTICSYPSNIWKTFIISTLNREIICKAITKLLMMLFFSTNGMSSFLSNSSDSFIYRMCSKFLNCYFQRCKQFVRLWKKYYFAKLFWNFMNHMISVSLCWFGLCIIYFFFGKFVKYIHYSR